jgi:hypothetical protein
MILTLWAVAYDLNCVIGNGADLTLPCRPWRQTKYCSEEPHQNFVQGTHSLKGQ